jgi:RND family efflux transporter MFP subunit
MMERLAGKFGKRQRIWAVSGVLVILVILTIALRGGGTETAQAELSAQEISARIMTVATSELPDEVTASGTVRPILESTVAPKIMSNVAGVYVREGDRVRQGQVLIRLESRDLQAQVSQAQAALSAAIANSQRAHTAIDLQKAETSTSIASAQAALTSAKEQLSIAKEGPRRQQKAQAHLATVQAHAQFKNSEIELNRMQRLFDQGVIPQQRLDGVKMAYEIAKAGYESAKQAEDMSDEGTRKQEVRSAEERVRQAQEALKMAKAGIVQNTMSKRNADAASSQVVQARAALEFARVQLGYAAITSPISGVVTQRMVDPGDTVSPGVPVIAVQDDSLYRLEASVPDGDVSHLHKGMAVDVSIGADQMKSRGIISVIAPSGDPGTRKFVVKVDLPKSVKVLAGNFGRMSFAVGHIQGIAVPESVVHDEGGLTSVFVADDNGYARMRVIKVGRTLKNGVEIVSGLASGDRVIVENTGVLADGVKVKLEGN